METLYTLLVFLILLLVVGFPCWRRVRNELREAKSRRGKTEQAGLHEPATLHPRIDVLACIGCGSCVQVCPEDVLAIVDGHAAIVNGAQCVGHSLCVEACPVGAIAMGFGTPREGMELPFYDEHFESNIRGLYIVGELGGIGLIKNATEQGVAAISRIASLRGARPSDTLDVVIVGGGPAGIAAALAAKAHELTYVLLEQHDLGGSILHYPRRKLVLTKPLELPLYGRVKSTEISKEELLLMLETIVKKHDIRIQTQQHVERIGRTDGHFEVGTPENKFLGSFVVLAIGRRGTPRRLNVPGEEMSKVCYRLIEAESYHDTSVLVVGGGDSAVEAAVALARQPGNRVTLSYRRDAFVRLKEKNMKNIAEMRSRRRIDVLFNSSVSEITEREVVIDTGGSTLRRLPNDYVFIFAGGQMPAEFLRNIGIEMRSTERVSGGGR